MFCRIEDLYSEWIFNTNKIHLSHTKLGDLTMIDYPNFFLFFFFFFTNRTSAVSGLNQISKLHEGWASWALQRLFLKDKSKDYFFRRLWDILLLYKFTLIPFFWELPLPSHSGKHYFLDHDIVTDTWPYLYKSVASRVVEYYCHIQLTSNNLKRKQIFIYGEFRYGFPWWFSKNPVLKPHMKATTPPLHFLQSQLNYMFYFLWWSLTFT